MNNRIDQTRPDAPELAKAGPYAVGVRTLQLINPGQPDVFGASGMVADRVLTVELWYPAVATAGEMATYATLLRDGYRTLALWCWVALAYLPRLGRRIGDLRIGFGKCTVLRCRRQT